MMKESLDQLAMDFSGNVQFAYVIKYEEEFLSLAYWVYRTPRSYYLSMDGKAYAFELIVTGRKTTKDWIDQKKYLYSPLIYKTPKIFPDW
jgi:hypothetical protein